MFKVARYVRVQQLAALALVSMRCACVVASGARLLGNLKAGRRDQRRRARRLDRRERVITLAPAFTLVYDTKGSLHLVERQRLRG